VAKCNCLGTVEFAKRRSAAFLLLAGFPAWAAFSAAHVAPAVTLPVRVASPAGLDLAAYRGKIVYLDFWASWCGPCRLSFPFMNGLRSSFPQGDLVVVAVNVDHSSAAARKFLQQQPANFTLLYDPTGQTAAKFNVSEMPTSILIGRDGRVRYVHKGFFQKDEPLYRRHIAELLRER